MQRENKWQDRLQDEFMDFWDSKKEELNLGEYSDAVTQFWLSKVDRAVAEERENWSGGLTGQEKRNIEEVY